MSEAPERIWAQPWPNGAVGDCWHNATTETERPWEFNEYLRTDLSQALVAAKLHEAAEVANFIADDCHAPLARSFQESFSAGCREVSRRVTELIDTDHQAALDAYVRREVEKERDRCAKIAEDEMKRNAAETYSGGAVTVHKSGQSAAKCYAAGAILAAIREAGHE